MTMTPLPELQDAVKTGTADRIARATVALHEVMVRDIQVASTGDLERLLREARATARTIDVILTDRAADHGKAVKP